MQSRRHSLLESATNVIVGYLIALASQIAVFPMFDIHVSLRSNLWIGVWFTGISLARSYALRRVFNRWHQPIAELPDLGEETLAEASELEREISGLGRQGRIV